MRSVEQHLEIILNQIAPLEEFAIGLLESRGCVNAEDIYAPWSLPAFDTAAIDGYAVKVTDVAGASSELPIRLTVADVIAVGERPAGAVINGSAIRVSAGAPLPEETEAVIPLEFTDAGLAEVNIERAAVMSQYIRRRGEDISEGELVLPAGQVMDPRAIGLVAAIGKSNVVARPRPRVVIVTIGAELLEPGAAVVPGKVIDSNGTMLAAAAAEAGASVYRIGPLAEDLESVRTVIEDQLVRADLVITIGGTGAGSYELIKQVCGELGTVDYTRVAMQPGMAQGFGKIGLDDTPIFTLPGNPVAAFVSFEIFVKPVISKMMGKSSGQSVIRKAIVENAFYSTLDRKHFVRAVRVPGKQHVVRALDVQGTHLVASLARTDCLIVVPELVQEVRSGDTVEVIDLVDESVW